METPGNYLQPETRTLEQIVEALRQLRESDRALILQFTLAILQDRRGKRATP